MDYYKNKTYYDILGVEQNASIESIEKAKNRLKFGDSDTRAPFSMWSKIDEAYVVLSNPTKRKEYDENLFLQPKNNSLRTNDSINDNVSVPSEHRKISHIINSQLPKLKKIGKNLVLALPTATLATIKIIKKLQNGQKYVLQEDSTEKKIEEVKTEESMLEENYRKKLEESIDKKLSEYHFNYGLEIDRVRYINHIELLKQKILLKENQKVERAGLLKYKLELTALMRQLDSFEKNLEIINKKINKSNKSQRGQKLTKLYENLVKVDEQITAEQNINSKNIFTLKKLNARRDVLSDKINLKIDKVKSSRGLYAIFKDSFTSAHVVTENFVENLFVPMNKIDEKMRNR